MSNDIQFSVNYLPVEDRLLMRGRFADGVEVRLLLTRRIVQGLVTIADKLAAALVKDQYADAHLSEEVAEFAREGAVEQADYTQSFRAGEPHPELGAAPRLVTAVAVTPLPEDQVALALTLDDGHKMNLQLRSDHLWGLVHLVQQQGQAAEWDLPRRRGAAAAGTGARSVH